MDIAVVDYGVSNLCSVVRALDYLGYDVMLTANPADLRKAPRILLPGQGAFATAMHNLQTSGLAEALQEEWKAGKPIMGICVGMQIMGRCGLENGTWPGLGWIDAECRQLETEESKSTGEPESEEADRTASERTQLSKTPSKLAFKVPLKHSSNHSLKLPHVGWNELCFDPAEPLLAGLKQRDHCVYFTHSYALVMDKVETSATPGIGNILAASPDVIATSDYGSAFVAAIKKDNVFAAQFHPEKSQENGLRILDNFMNWNPC